MKKIIFLFPVLVTFALVACNEVDQTAQNKEGKDKTLLDSLWDEVINGRKDGMSRKERLTKLQEQAKQLIDSIGKLPEKARKEAAPVKDQLDSLAKDLEKVNTDMDKWMKDFNMDSALDNIEQRIRYLGEEKLKINELQDAIRNSLKRADSLIKKVNKS